MKHKLKIILKRTLLGFLIFNALLVVISLFYPLENSFSKDNYLEDNLNLLERDEARESQELKINALTLDLTNDPFYGDVYKWDKNKNDTLSFDFNIEASSLYEVSFDYASLQANVTNISIDLIVDGVTNAKWQNLILNSYWKNETEEVKYDIYNNQVASLQIPYKLFKNSFLYEQRNYEKTPLVFDLSAGTHHFEIKRNSGEFLLGSIYFVKKTDLQAYDASKFTKDISLTKEVITLEGEKPVFKNDTSIQTSSVLTPNMYPFSTKHKLLNVLSGDSFNKSGFEVTYAFKVKKSGNYNLTFKYANTQPNTYSYADIYLDNLLLCDELNRYKFKGTQKYLNETLKTADNEKMAFYLEAGIHTITVKINASLQADIYYEMQAIINEISKLYLEVIKLTGGDNDPNKQWDILKYIPDCKVRLDDWVNRLENLLVLIDEVSKVNAKKDNTLSQYVSNALGKLKSIAKKPNSLPHKLNILQTSTSSASSLLSSSLHTSTFSPLSIDRIYVHSTDVNMKTEKTNFFLQFFSTVQRIFRSGLNIPKEDVLEVWVNRSTYYVSSMQKFSDAYFTPKSKIKVRFSLLPDESKLTYAYAAKTEPDVALGVSSALPYDLGIRGALEDLSSFDGFNKIISEMAPGALVNLGCDEKIYGIPETGDFQIMYYRKDLLLDEGSIGIEIPETWDDVINILPLLQRFGMNFFIPMAGGAGLKGLSSTAPFIYQYGGKLYQDDYFKVDIDSKEAIAAINLMVDLFQLYSLPLTSQNFYDDFRKGTMPIGIAGFDVYLQLTNAAPEIASKWGVSLIPGVRRSDGTINRTSTGDTKNAVMFKGTKHKEEGFEFLKWWLSSETQSSFANVIQSTYGPTFLWNTANLKAFETLAIEDDVKEVILAQYDNLLNIVQTPATYMVERGLSNIWNKAVFENQPVRGLISDATLEINKELARKMAEFGYLDQNGKVLKPYKVYTKEDIIRLGKEG